MMAMRNALMCLGIAGFVSLNAACSSRPTTIPLVSFASIATYEEEQVSQAPAGAVMVMLDSSQFEKYSEALLIVSNSTEQAIESPTCGSRRLSAVSKVTLALVRAITVSNHGFTSST